MHGLATGSGRLPSTLLQVLLPECHHPPAAQHDACHVCQQDLYLSVLAPVIAKHLKLCMLLLSRVLLLMAHGAGSNYTCLSVVLCMYDQHVQDHAQHCPANCVDNHCQRHVCTNLCISLCTPDCVHLHHIIIKVCLFMSAQTQLPQL